MSVTPIHAQRALSILAIADLIETQAQAPGMRDALLDGTGINDTDLLNPDALITPRQEQAFFRNWCRLDGRAHCGIDVGHHYRLSHFGHLGLILPHAATRRQAIDLFLRFINLSYTHFTPQADVIQGILTLHGGEHLKDLRRFYLDRDVAFTVNLIREFFGEGGMPLIRVCFDYACSPDQASWYAQQLGVPVVFDALHTQVEVDPSKLDAPMPGANALIVRMLEPACTERAFKVVQSCSPIQWADRVVAALHEHEATHPWPDAAQIAERLKCSERTLRRQLAAEGHRFQVLSDEVRARKAEQWLQQTDHSLDQIAHALGYSEAAAFIRAYKRWHGRPPRTVAAPVMQNQRP